MTPERLADLAWRLYRATGIGWPYRLAWAWWAREEPLRTLLFEELVAWYAQRR